MSNEHDSAISISSDTKREDDMTHTDEIVHMDDLKTNEVPKKKSTSPSIESNTLDHAATVPKRTVEIGSSTLVNSTTVLDVDDGIGGKETADKIYKKVRENIVLTIVITIVCGIILTPIILFYTRPDGINPFETNRMQATYGTFDSQSCGTLKNSRLFYESAESDLSAIINVTSSDQDCANLAPAFFCNATYRSCTNAMLVPPTTVECEMLRDNLCSSQWAQLENISSVLTDCNTYASRTCPEQFRPACDGTCIPLCSEFSQNNAGITILVSVVTGVISNLTNFIGGIIIFIFAFFRRKTMFRFPQILVLYSTATVTITVFVTTISYFGTDVLCSDENLFVALSDPTAYCEIYGFTLQAGFLIFSGFWLLFVAHLFLKLVYPLQFHNFDNYKHRTKIHILEIVAVLLIGLLIPSIVVGTSEYGIVNFPPTQCSADVEVTFYTLILPTILIQGAGMMLILFSFVSIHRRKGIFKLPRGNKRMCIEFTTPEVKLLLVFLYLTLVLCVYWADFSTSLRNRNRLFTAIFDYITCVNNVRPTNCDELREDIFDASIPSLRVIALLMTSLVNFSNVVFVLQFKDVKKRLRTLTKRFTSKNFDGTTFDGINHDTNNAPKQHKETDV